MNRLYKLASTALGFVVGTGCFVAEYGAPVPAYGMPDTDWYGDYELAGTTVDADSGALIQGIQVSFAGEVTRTDDQGAWTLVADYPCEEDCTLRATDIDGPDNGSYQDAEIDWSGGEQFDYDVELELEPEVEGS